MKYSKIIWGLVLIGLGCLILLDNMGVIDFAWHSIWKLWPLALVMWGISIIPVSDYIKLALALLAISLGVYYVIQVQEPNVRAEWDSDTEIENLNQVLMADLKPSTTGVNIDLEAAAGVYRIDATTQHLFEFRNEGTFGSYDVEQGGNDTTVTLTIKPGSPHFETSNTADNQVWLKLNPKPEYTFNIDAGAADLAADLSLLKSPDISIDGGATKISVKLGDQADTTRLSVNAGVASISIEIPTTSGCEIQTNNFLSNKTFPGFIQISKGLYRTGNYQSSTKKILIQSQVALASFGIKRY